METVSNVDVLRLVGVNGGSLDELVGVSRGGNRTPVHLTFAMLG